MDRELSNWEYFKWGAVNHPGKELYAVIPFTLILASFLNKNSVLGALLVSLIFIISLFVMFIVTSISVGKANKKLVLEDMEENRDKLYKIRPLLNQLSKKFLELFEPFMNICVDVI